MKKRITSLHKRPVPVQVPAPTNRWGDPQYRMVYIDIPTKHKCTLDVHDPAPVNTGFMDNLLIFQRGPGIEWYYGNPLIGSYPICVELSGSTYRFAYATHANLFVETFGGTFFDMNNDRRIRGQRTYRMVYIGTDGLITYETSNPINLHQDMRNLHIFERGSNNDWYHQSYQERNAYDFAVLLNTETYQFSYGPHAQEFARIFGGNYVSLSQEPRNRGPNIYRSVYLDIRDTDTHVQDYAHHATRNQSNIVQGTEWIFHLEPNNYHWVFGPPLENYPIAVELRYETYRFGDVEQANRFIMAFGGQMLNRTDLFQPL